MPRHPYVVNHINEIASIPTPYEKTVCDVNLRIDKDVYPTGEIGKLFYRALTHAEYGIKPGQKVLDYGTGTGYLAIQAAKLGASEVVAIDINPAAVNCAKHNAKVNNVHVTIREQDAFEKMPANEKFDVIVTGCPWDDAKPENSLELSVFDEDFKMRRALFKEGKKHLNSNGYMFFSYSKRAQDNVPIEKFIARGYKHDILVETSIDDDPHFIYRIYQSPSPKAKL